MILNRTSFLSLTRENISTQVTFIRKSVFHDTLSWNDMAPQFIKETVPPPDSLQRAYIDEFVRMEELGFSVPMMVDFSDAGG